jgi:carboxyl-terminal processing protease
MNNSNTKRAIYLPIAFAVVLIAGILLGNRLTRVSSPSEDKIFFMKPEKYNKVDNVINYIQQDYVDSISRKTIEENAINGILEKLDPHSQYIPAEEFNEVNDPLMGNFEGIGIQFRIEKDTIMVIQTIAGGPSEKVGLLAGDRIVKINDTLVAGVGIKNTDAVHKLKGKRSTTVKVSIHRRHVPGLIDFTITRDVIQTYSVDIAYMVNDSIGYLKLSKFASTTYEEFMAAMKKLLASGMKRLILDLRGNSGGYLNAAVQICDEFLDDKKLIVYTEGNSRPNNYAYASKKGLFEVQPLEVLIDEGSASASEIVAGAIQDNDRGTIIGRRSFGKGLVQEQLDLPDGSALRLTVARYHTPTGRNIQRPYNHGIEKYYEEMHDRFVDGEMQNPDSIRFNDSLKFTTPKGKVVYGGGGIMPDIYVTFRPDGKDKYYNALLRKNLIFQFAFDYTDQNRESLKQYDTFDKFDKGFTVTPAMFNNLVTTAKTDSVTGTRKEIDDSMTKTEILTKAFIGRNILNDQGFYPIYNRIDGSFLAAVKEMEK